MGRPLLSQLGKEPQTCHLERGGEAHWHVSLPHGMLLAPWLPALLPPLPSPSGPDMIYHPPRGSSPLSPLSPSPTQLALCPLKAFAAVWLCVSRAVVFWVPIFCKDKNIGSVVLRDGLLTLNLWGSHGLAKHNKQMLFHAGEKKN